MVEASKQAVVVLPVYRPVVDAILDDHALANAILVGHPVQR